MAFLNNSFFETISARVTAIESAIPSNLAARLSALEGQNFSGLVSRVAALEAWRANKSSAIADVSFTVSSSSIEILGIQVPTAAAFTGHTNALNAVKTTLNSILAALRSREIIIT